MPTLKAVIDAKDAPRGAQLFNTATASMGAAARGVDRDIRNAEKGTSGMVASAGRLSSGFSALALKAAGVGAALSFVGSVVREVRQAMQEMGNATVLFERQLTELFSLGANIQNTRALREEVLGISSAWGIARNEIADALFSLQSATSNLAEVQRRQLLASTLELQKVYGGALNEDLLALVKIYQIYGPLGETISGIQQKLAFTAEEGVLTFADLSSQFADVASKAQAMGASLNEASAAVIVATQRGGDTNRTLTATGNIFLRLEEASKKGIELTGSFTDKLRQLQSATRLQRIEIFGAENIAAANNLISSVEQLEDVLKRLGSGLPDIGDKLATRLEDASSRFASVITLLRMATENAMISPAFIEQHGGTLTNQQAAALGLKTRAGAFAPADQAITNVSTLFLGKLLGLPDQFLSENIPSFNPETGRIERFQDTRRGLNVGARTALEKGRLNEAEDLISRLEGFEDPNAAGLRGLLEVQRDQARTERLRDLEEFKRSQFGRRFKVEAGASLYNLAVRDIEQNLSGNDPSIQLPPIFRQFLDARRRGVAGDQVLQRFTQSNITPAGLPFVDDNGVVVQQAGRSSSATSYLQFIEEQENLERATSSALSGARSLVNRVSGFFAGREGGSTFQRGVAGAFKSFAGLTFGDADPRARANEIMSEALNEAEVAMLTMLAGVGDATAEAELKKIRMREEVQKRIDAIQAEILAISDPELAAQAKIVLERLRNFSAEEVDRVNRRTPDLGGLSGLSSAVQTSTRFRGLSEGFTGSNVQSLAIENTERNTREAKDVAKEQLNTMKDLVQEFKNAGRWPAGFRPIHIGGS